MRKFGSLYNALAMPILCLCPPESLTPLSPILVFTPSGRLIQRPYEDGNELSYYKELYAKDRESIIDSLKELRPKYLTKSGRTVYGGGGITPDIYIPFKSNINNETGSVLRNPKRPFFNFASVGNTTNASDVNIIIHI